MKNVIIMGSGRSGTSLVAGTLANAGYFMGNSLIKPSEFNPKGFFEDREINLINEEILAANTLKRPPLIGNIFFRSRPLKNQRWLAQVPVDKTIKEPAGVEDRIVSVVNQTPFCFKDPRFCYTLPVWLPHFVNVVFIVVFRHPAVTANSIERQCRTDVRLHTLRMDFNRALQVWTLMYRHILEKHRHRGEWLFLHYKQLFSSPTMARIERFTQASVDRTFPDPNLNRTRMSGKITQEARQIYERLCALAEFNEADRL